jgi:DNA repair photolyase
MRLFTNPISVTSQVVFCGLPLRLDTYAGCGFRCSYCFARARGGNTHESGVRPANPETIKNVFELSIKKQRFENGIVAQFLRRRVPIHFGGMSDPFQRAGLPPQLRTALPGREKVFTSRLAPVVTPGLTALQICRL